jgi:hypothetical protein
LFFGFGIKKPKTNHGKIGFSSTRIISLFFSRCAGMKNAKKYGTKIVFELKTIQKAI